MHANQLTLCVAAVYGGKTKRVQWEREYFTPAHLNVMDSRHCEEGEMAEKQSKRKRAEEYKQRRKLVKKKKWAKNLGRSTKGRGVFVFVINNPSAESYSPFNVE